MSASSLNNSTKGQFLDRSSSFSTRGSRTGANLLGWEEPETITKQQRIEALQARLKQLHLWLAEAEKGTPYRKKVGIEYARLCQRLSEIRGYSKSCRKNQYQTLEACFMNVAHDRLPSYQFKQLMREAQIKAGMREVGSDDPTVPDQNQ